MKTLLLNPQTWDLVLDANGNIAAATQQYAIAQDVASACRLFLGELWFDTRQGVPYFQKILGMLPPVGLVRAQFELAAMTVPGVVTAKCTITSFTNRSLSGQILVTDASGVVIPVTIPTFLSSFILNKSTLG